MAISFGIDPALLGRLLKKQSIERGIFVLRVILWSIAALCFTLLGYSIWQSHNSNKLALGILTSRVNKIIEANNGPIVKTQAMTDFSAVTTAKIFGELTTTIQPEVRATPKPTVEIALGLVGTVVTDGEEPYAIIEDSKKNTQDVFNLGDQVYGAGVVKAIYGDKVELELNGQIRTLVIDDAPAKGSEAKGGIASLGGDEFAVDEAELNTALENLPMLMTQARAVPYFKDGKSVGLRLFAIRPGSIYEKVGLVNGDILKAINGNDLADFTQAIKLFEKLKEERTIALTLEREGKDRNFRYSIR